MSITVDEGEVMSSNISPLQVDDGFEKSGFRRLGHEGDDFDFDFDDDFGDLDDFLGGSSRLSSLLK